MLVARLGGAIVVAALVGCGGTSATSSEPTPPTSPTHDGIMPPPEGIPTQGAEPPVHPELFGPIDESGIAPSACTADGHVRMLAGLELAEPADYLELRRELVGPGFATPSGLEDTRPAGQPGHITVVESEGTPSADLSGVRIAIAPGEFDDSTCSPNGWCAQYFAFSRETEVGTIDSRSGLLSALGSVDTPAKALVVAWSADYGLLCAGPAGTKVRPVSGGFEVVAARSTLGGSLTRFLLRVDASGKVTPLASQPM